MGTDEIELIAHLMRRAGFGATRTEIEAYAAQGYDATVEALLHPTNPQWMGDYMIRRFHHEQWCCRGRHCLCGVARDHRAEAFEDRRRAGATLACRADESVDGEPGGHG